jgi:hypothetical protein
MNAGCYSFFSYCCVFFYADEILLLSPSIAGLQQLVNACELECELDTQIGSKVHGSLFAVPCYFWRFVWEKGCDH